MPRAYDPGTCLPSCHAKASAAAEASTKAGLARRKRVPACASTRLAHAAEKIRAFLKDPTLNYRFHLLMDASPGTWD